MTQLMMIDGFSTWNPIIRDGLSSGIVLDPDLAKGPESWEAPRVVFLAGGMDPFHPDVPDEVVAALWDIMWAASKHVFLVVTEYPERMRTWTTTNAYQENLTPGSAHYYRDFLADDLCGWDEEPARDDRHACGRLYCNCPLPGNPHPFTNGRNRCSAASCPIMSEATVADLRRLGEDELAADYVDPHFDEDTTLAVGWTVLHSRPRLASADNVWVGIVVRNQAEADAGIPQLLVTPTAGRLLYTSPAGPVEIPDEYLTGEYAPRDSGGAMAEETGAKIEWVIVAGAREGLLHPDRVRSLRDQCQASGTLFFFAGWGDWAPYRISDNPVCDLVGLRDNEVVFSCPPGWMSMIRVGPEAAGRLLDGRTWDEIPDAFAVPLIAGGGGQA